MSHDAAYALGEFLGSAFADYRARRVAQKNQAAYDELFNEACRRINTCNAMIDERDARIAKLERKNKELRESDQMHREAADYWKNRRARGWRLAAQFSDRALEERAQRVAFAHELAKLDPEHPLLRKFEVRQAVVEAAREYKNSGDRPYIPDWDTDQPVIDRLEQELARLPRLYRYYEAMSASSINEQHAADHNDEPPF